MYRLEQRATPEVSSFYRSIPEHCIDIDNIVLGDAIHAGNPAVQKYADVHYLVQNCAWMSTPLSTTDSVKTASPSSKRGLLLEKGHFIDANSNHFGLVTGIGTGPLQTDSWEAYQNGCEKNQPDTPFGLTGYNSRLRDYNVTTEWERAGVLTTTTVALIPLKAENLVDWYEKELPNSPYHLRTALERILQNGDVPVQQIRLIRSSRMDDEETNLPYLQNYFKHGMTMLHHQLLANPGPYHVPSKYKNMVARLGMQEAYKWSEYDTQLALRTLGFFYGRNAGVFKLNPALALPLPHNQNCDKAGSFIDAETSPIPGKGIFTDIEGVLKGWGGITHMLNDYTALLTKNSLGVTDSARQLTEDCVFEGYNSVYVRHTLPSQL